jgi:hypothetical protein
MSVLDVLAPSPPNVLEQSSESLGALLALLLHLPSVTSHIKTVWHWRRSGAAARRDVKKILNSCANILDAMLPIRNRASLVHPNQEPLDEPEARLVINVGRCLLHYVDSKVS